jgi:aminoglycoside phosphotransferase (APT) family kinase protein
MKPGPDPVMKASLCWLERNLPVPRRLCLVHGDPGFWNLLVKDGRLSALLDWELWHLGDPIEDVSYVKGFVETIMSWEDFLAAYRAAGGVEYDSCAGEYYGIFRDVRNALFSHFAGNAFRTGRNPELRMAHCEMKSYNMLLLRGAQRILDRERLGSEAAARPIAPQREGELEA